MTERALVRGIRGAGEERIEITRRVRVEAAAREAAKLRRHGWRVTIEDGTNEVNEEKRGPQCEARDNRV